MSAKSNKIGVVQLTILTMVNMMGSGIIMLPTKLAEIGTISIVSWLVTAVGSTALAYAFAQCGMFSKKSGGMGGYAEYSFGKATYIELSNHFQPMIEIPTTGIITPQMVNELMLPVILAPPKLRMVASHSVKIVHNAIESGERVAPRNSEP